MFEKLYSIAKEYDLKLKFMTLPDKIRAFILEIDGSIYVVVNESLPDEEKEKAFRTRITTL
ncbi:MAG: hypothetical protein IKP07_04385 [Bacilli bacterium]|nr:hypothetical protein [Bacilli bacterium]